MDADQTIALDELASIINDAKTVAKRYRNLTGRPLGITGEVAEYEAARLLGLRLAGVRQDGYDAICETSGLAYRLQIKGRCILDDGRRSQQVPSINREKEWDGVLLVLLDGDFEPTEIYEADRLPIIAVLEGPGSKARTERGAMAVSKFKAIGRRVWSKKAHQEELPPVTIMTPQIRENKRRSKEMVLCGYFLARCGDRTKGRALPPPVLGTSSWTQAYDLFYARLGDGRTPVAFSSSLRLTRDAFDPHFYTGRRGFWQRPLSEEEQVIFDQWQSKSCDDLWMKVQDVGLTATP
jgi:hypothetical protein